MTRFEQMLNYSPGIIAGISKWTMDEQKEIIFIAQALIAMGDDELREGEMVVKVTHATDGNWYKLGSKYIVREVGPGWKLYKATRNECGGIWKTDYEIVRKYEKE